jgi:hypothetical protein
MLFHGHRYPCALSSTIKPRQMKKVQYMKENAYLSILILLLVLAPMTFALYSTLDTRFEARAVSLQASLQTIASVAYIHGLCGGSPVPLLYTLISIVFIQGRDTKACFLPLLYTLKPSGTARFSSAPRGSLVGTEANLLPCSHKRSMMSRISGRITIHATI